MSLKKSFIAAALLVSMGTITYAQTPATKPAKKDKPKTEKSAADSTKHAHKGAGKKGA